MTTIGTPKKNPSNIVAKVWKRYSNHNTKWCWPQIPFASLWFFSPFLLTYKSIWAKFFSVLSLYARFYAFDLNRSSCRLICCEKDTLQKGNVANKLNLLSYNISVFEKLKNIFPVDDFSVMIWIINDFDWRDAMCIFEEE